LMAKRTDTKIAVLVQVMDELGFDREIIANVSGVPQRTVSDIVNWRGCWANTGEFNEVRETYRLYLRNCIRDEAAVLAHVVVKRFEETIAGADYLTALRIANAATSLAARVEDWR
jgi:hypothetical protein